MPRRMLASIIALALVWPTFAAEPKPAEALREFVKKNATRHAVGLYLKGKKVGWMIEELKLGRHAGQEVAVETSEMLIATLSDGEKTEMKRKSITYYSLDGDGPIVAAEEVGTEDGQDTVFTVVPAGAGLKITTTTGKRKTTREVPMPKANLAIARKLMQWLTSDLAPGATFEHFGTSWELPDVNDKDVFTYQSKKKILWGGVSTDVYSVRIDMNGAKFDAEVLANGNPVRGKLGGLFELRAESEEVAKKLEAANIDMLAASSIKLDYDLGNAKRVTALTLEVTGIKDFALPVSHRQTVGNDQGKTILALKTDFRTGKSSALSAADRKKYTEATPTIQSDQEPIRKLAAKIIGDETDPIKKATLLKDWVYTKLRKTMACNATTSLAVLDNQAGDCTEHSLLFVALARAAGLPARELTGVAYVAPIFGWHAWAEIHDGQQWVSVDPTWNELYVDATHIVFTHDTNDHAWLNVLGSIQFKVVSVTKIAE